MKTLAAILVETGKPLVLDEIEIPVLKPGQTLVEIMFSGVCHTQVLECRGYRGQDKFLPHCLGHEASGIVRDVGPDVAKVMPGDTVIMSWIKGSGGDVPGTVYSWKGRNVNSGAITTFSRYAVVSENRLTRMPEGMSMEKAALVGCAVATGAGAVFNAAGATAEAAAGVFGVGGVGLCAVAACAAVGCSHVVAVDILDSKLEAGKRMGATHCVNASAGDPAGAIKEIVPAGLDFAVESSGRPPVMLQALEAVRPRGGAAVIIGNARHGEMLTFSPGILNQGKRILGTWGGDSVPDRDFPKYCDLIRSGTLNIDPLISGIYSLEQINNAIDDLESGATVRPLVDMKL